MSYPPGFLSYVLFNPDTRELISSHLQIPVPGHENRIEVSDEVRVSWPIYMLNEDMTALVKNPIYWPDEFPPTEPEDPPVDPEPDEPVQSGN